MHNWLLFLWAGLAALGYTLAQGEFVSRAYMATLNRSGNFISPVLHALQGTLYEEHPTFRIVSEVANNTLPTKLLSLLASSGIDFYYAAGIMRAIFRTINIAFIIPWFMTAKISPWFGVFILPVIFTETWRYIYGFIPTSPQTGVVGPALFMSACGFLVIKRIKHR
jgi:hypothetical protein